MKTDAILSNNLRLHLQCKSVFVMYTVHVLYPQHTMYTIQSTSKYNETTSPPAGRTYTVSLLCAIQCTYMCNDKTIDLISSRKNIHKANPVIQPLVIMQMQYSNF